MRIISVDYLFEDKSNTKKVTGANVVYIDEFKSRYAAQYTTERELQALQIAILDQMETDGNH